jgi:hypothetical protein
MIRITGNQCQTEEAPVLYWIEKEDGSRELWWHRGLGDRVLVKTEK